MCVVLSPIDPTIRDTVHLGCKQFSIRKLPVSLPFYGSLTTDWNLAATGRYFLSPYFPPPPPFFFFFGDAGRPSATATAWNSSGGKALNPGRSLYAVCAQLLVTMIATGSCPLPTLPFLLPITFLLQIIRTLNIGRHSSLVAEERHLEFIAIQFRISKSNSLLRTPRQ